jgi:hypothetical protein
MGWDGMGWDGMGWDGTFLKFVQITSFDVVENSIIEIKLST